MKKTLMISVGVLAALGATSVLAHGDGKRGMRDSGARMEQMFERFDANADGSITKAEVEAFKATQFAAADANGDQKLSYDEMLAHMQSERAARQAERFAEMDANGDGVVSAEEFGSRRFDRLDADGDGSLTAEEMAAAHERGPRGAGRGDGDGEREGRRMGKRHGDGEGRHAERGGHGKRGEHGMRGGRGGGMSFARLDANQDGFVTLDEMNASDRMFDRLDADGDGAITKAEVEEKAKGRRGRGWGRGAPSE